jgi:hypothetical protein
MAESVGEQRKAAWALRSSGGSAGEQAEAAWAPTSGGRSACELTNTAWVKGRRRARERRDGRGILVCSCEKTVSDASETINYEASLSF